MNDQVIQFGSGQVQGDTFEFFGTTDLWHDWNRPHRKIDGTDPGEDARYSDGRSHAARIGRPHFNVFLAAVPRTRRGIRYAPAVSDDDLLPLDDPEVYRALGDMLIAITEAEKLLGRVHTLAVGIGAYGMLEHLDSELFWKVRAAGDHLRDILDVERVHGGYT